VSGAEVLDEGSPTRDVVCGSVDPVGEPERLSGAPDAWERLDSWTERHVVLAFVAALVVGGLVVAVIAVARSWLEGRGPQGSFVLGLVVGALAGGYVVRCHHRRNRI
jgi:hypothetical protein